MISVVCICRYGGTLQRLGDRCAQALRKADGVAALLTLLVSDSRGDVRTAAAECLLQFVLCGEVSVVCCLFVCQVHVVLLTIPFVVHFVLYSRVSLALF